VAGVVEHELHCETLGQQQKCHQDGGRVQCAHARQSQNMRQAGHLYTPD